MLRGLRKRFDEHRPGERLTQDVDLGSTDYIFQSDRGTDYQYFAADDSGAVRFSGPSGVPVTLHILSARYGGGRGRLFRVAIDDDLVAGPGLSSAEAAPRPIRELIRQAVVDVNAESRARRVRERDVIERAGAATPSAPEPTPLNHLRSEFDLGPDDYDFASASRDYEYWAAKPEEEDAAVRFSAPSGAEVFLVLVPQVSLGLREVRMKASIDDVPIADSPLLSVQQFPTAIQRLMRDVIADLNREFEGRLARNEEAVDQAGQRNDNDWPTRA